MSNDRLEQIPENIRLYIDMTAKLTATECEKAILSHAKECPVSKRVDVIERWQAKVTGIAIGIGLLSGVTGALFAKLIGV